MFDVWENKVFILLHGEQELPAQRSIEVRIHHWLSQGLSCGGLQERHSHILQVPIGIAINSNVMCTGCLHIIDWTAMTFIIGDGLAKVVFGFMKRYGAEHTTDADALDGDALLLIEIDGILVEVRECLLGIAIELFQTCQQDSADAYIYDFIEFQVWLHRFTNGIIVLVIY